MEQWPKVCRSTLRTGAMEPAAICKGGQTHVHCYLTPCDIPGFGQPVPTANNVCGGLIGTTLLLSGLSASRLCQSWCLWRWWLVSRIHVHLAAAQGLPNDGGGTVGSADATAALRATYPRANTWQTSYKLSPRAACSDSGDSLGAA